MSKICICGHFGGTKEFLDGQTVKTKNIYMRMFSTDMIHFLSANLQSAQTQLHI